jgi:hypothetical protein
VRVDCQDNVQAIGQLVRSQDYDIDPVAVADAILRRFTWDDLPGAELATVEAGHDPRPPRLRGLVRVRRLGSPVLARRAPLSA